ncbi:MAG TPA: helix-turn-helix domain-containing protein [Candidatus Acidoferrum sp.]|nr:helix-turn-helix domain-containing protein [Candidatus Acidoferrum sp.]
MPRKPDEAVEGRIVDAAYRIWSQSGEVALTMRAVARAAGTTTPTLYQRFRNKRDLRHFLEERARQKLFDSLQAAGTATEVCRNALDFSSSHSNEYRLLTTDWGIRYAQSLPMRSFEYLKQVLAKELGGGAAEHGELAFQLFAVVHGTALLRPMEPANEATAQELREACLKACSALLRDAARQRKRKPKRKSN